MAIFSETNLPRYNAEDLPGTTKKLYNFCREMQEMLLFVLANLDADNIEGYEEIFNRLTNSEGAVSVLRQTAGEIAAQVRQGEEKLAELQVTADGISSRVQDTEKGVSELRQTAEGLAARVGDNAGDIAALQLTAQGFETRVSSAEGSISSLKQTAQGLESRVSDAEGSISQVKQTAKGLETRVSSAEGSISQVKQTAKGLESTVSDLNGKYTSIKQTVDSIDIEGTVNLMVRDGFAEFLIVDNRGRTAGALTSDGRILAIGGEQGIFMNGGTGGVSIVSGDVIALGNSPEEVQIWVSSRRYWTFSTSGIYYCDEDGSRLNSVMLSGS